MAAPVVPDTVRLTLRVLARLLDYPGPELRACHAELPAALDTEGALSAPRRAELAAFLAWFAVQDPFDMEAAYVELFDRGHATSLYLFEHVHGDSRDRGPAMLDLARTYDAAGLVLCGGEMPDYLPAVLEYASTLSPAAGCALLAEIAHLLNAIRSALRERGSPYATLFDALLELAGVAPEAVAVASERPLDAAWEEPPVFAGCSAPGQTRPGAPQAIHFTRRPLAQAGDPA